MEDEERAKKLEAGREQLAAYVKKKQASSSKHPKKRREMEDNGDVACSSDEVIAENSPSSLKSTVSANFDVEDSSEMHSVLAELEDVLAIKQQQLAETKEEVFSSCEIGLKNGDLQAELDSKYRARIEQFEGAVKHRDEVIKRLTVSLKETLSQRDQLANEIGQLTSSAADSQNKLQQFKIMQLVDPENSPSKQMMGYQQKLQETEVCLVEQMKQIQRLTEVVAEKETEIMLIKQDLVAQKSKSAAEVKQLMSEVQRLHQESMTLRAEQDDLVVQHEQDMEKQRSQLEEDFGLQLGQITEQWRQIQAQQQEKLDKQHTHDIEVIRATHGEEIAKLRQALLDHTSPNTQAAQLQQQLEQLSSQLREQQSSWSEDKTSLQFELESLKAQLSQVEVEKHHLDELANEKDKSLLALTEKLNEIESEKENMTISFESKINLLQNLNNENEKMILELKNHYKVLETENNNLNEKIKTVDFERENLNQELSKVRSIQSKCDLLQAEYMGVLSEKKDVENEMAHLYSQVKSLKQQVASKKVEKKVNEQSEDVACVQFENEVDAAEKGVFSPKRQKLDVPTSPASIIMWIEKCESLEKELRTAQANVLRLQTQLQNEELQTKLLSNEKIATAQKMKELQEKNSSLQRTAGSISRSKKLMNQFEMKIASLENEKSNLTKSLQQLGNELKKSQTVYEEKLSNLQEQICNSLNVKTDNIEELIIESCSKAKELVVLKETIRSHIDNTNTLQNKIELLDKLVSDHEESFKASQEELQHTQEQLAECWDKIDAKDELLSARDRDIALLNLQREQLERKTKVLSQSTQLSGTQKELLSLVEEMATEMFELKLALTSEKTKSDSLSREISPFKTECKLENSELFQKLQNHHKTILGMKAERNLVDLAVVLEAQQLEIIDEVTNYASQHASLIEAGKTTSALQQDLLLQKEQMDQKLQDRSNLDLQLTQEQNNLRGAKLQIKLLETQLADKDKQHQELLAQQEILEQELLNLESTLETQEELLQEQRLRLETEVRHRELQMKQCQAEARCREIEFLLPQTTTTTAEIKQDTDFDVTSGSMQKLEEMRVALDEVHAAAITRLKLHLSEQMDLCVSNLSEEYTRQLSDTQEQHSQQVCDLSKKLTEKEETQRSQSHLDILAQLGLPPTCDTAQARLRMQEKLRQDLNLLRQGLSETEVSVYGMLESKFQQLAQHQVLLAVATLREESEASFAREISSLNLAHTETLKSLQAKLCHEREREMHQIKRDLIAHHTDHANESKGAEGKLHVLLKQEKDQENQAILHQIEINTRKVYSKTIQGLQECWIEKCKSELQSIVSQMNEIFKSENVDTDQVEVLGNIQQRLVMRAREMRSTMSEQHAQQVDILISSVQVKHRELQDSIYAAQELESLHRQVELLIKERDELLEHRRTVEDLQKIVSEYELNNAKVKELMKQKEEEHQEAMDDLKAYFQKIVVDVQKQYSDSIQSQHSRNSSSPSSENELISDLCADGDHATRLLALSSTRICDTFSDIPSISDTNERTKDLERRLGNYKSEHENMKQQLEAKCESDIQKIKYEHEQHIMDLVKQLNKGHDDSLNSIAKSHKIKISQLESQYQTHLTEQLDQLRSEMFMSESLKLEALRLELEASYTREIEELKCSFTESRVNATNVTDNEKENLESPNHDLKSQLRQELRADFDKELRAKLQEQEDIIAKQVEETLESIKKESEKDQARLCAANQEMLADHQRHLQELKNKYDANLLEVQAKLRDLHQAELTSLEERHCRATEILRATLVENVAIEYKRKTEELLEELHNSHQQKLEQVELRLREAYNVELDKLKTALEQQEASYVHLLDETRNMHGRELAQQAETHRQQLHDAVEQTKHDLVKTLGEQMQAMLAEDVGCENWPRELQLLSERLNAETHKELAELRAQHEAYVRHLQEQHEQELAVLRAAPRPNSQQSRELWEKQCQSLRRLVNELLQYMITIEEELNCLVDQSRCSDLESIASSEVSTECASYAAKKVHFAPDVEVVTGLLNDSTLSDVDSTMLEDLQAELNKCLLRVRKDVSELLGMPETSVVGQKSSQEVEILKVRLFESEKMRETLKLEVLAMRDRLSDVERKKREVINEGYGEGIEEHPDVEKRLERLSEIQDRARSVLSAEDPSDPPHLLQLIEALTREGDLLAEEARRDKEDLQLQIEAADKQLKSTRQFLEEQAAEREQERDEYSREIAELRDSLKERERDRLECTRQAKEIEALEIQAKENVQQLQDADTKLEELNANLKASSDKISVLRDVIHDLENQVEQKGVAENELKKRLQSLQLAFDEESQSHHKLVDQLDSEPSTAELNDHIAELEERIFAYNQELQHLKNNSPALREMKAQLRSMESSLDRRTKELERLHNTSMSTCSSPSEDVSVREQLEASRASVCSPEGELSSPISLRRLQDKLQHHARAEEAAFKRIRDLEMQLHSIRHNEEEIHVERDALQQKVEEQLLQISSLQASLDQQRLQQSVGEARDAAFTRRQLQASAERLDQARDLLQAKDTEICELRGQLEKTKKVIESQEEELTKKTKETDEEITKLREQLEELNREKESLEVSVEEARSTPRLNYRLLAEKNAEIDELGMQLSIFKEHLDLIKSHLSSDTSKEDIMNQLSELRTSHGELRSHYSALHSTLHSSGRTDMEVLREARPDSTDLTSQQSSISPCVSIQASETSLQAMPAPAVLSVREEAERSMQSDFSGHTPDIPRPDVSMLEEQVSITKQQLAEKEAQIEELKIKLKESSEQLNDEIKRLREENNQLKVELNAFSGRLEEYAHLMQSEMEQSASLDQSLLQASNALLGNDRESLDAAKSGDLSLRSENLQRLLARVHKGGFEVLSLSEVALLHKHTHSLLHADKVAVATQTSRSGFSDAKQSAELQQQLTALEQTAASRDKRMAARVESLEAALSHEKQISHETAQSLDKEQEQLAEVRCTLETQTTELKQLRERHAELTALLACEQKNLTEARKAQTTQVAEMQQLREKSEEVQSRVTHQEYTMQQLRLDLDKERMRASALESSLAAEELNTYKQRAHYEGECVRHQATMRRNSALTEMLDSKLTHAKQIENTLREKLEQEQSIRRTLQEQVSALQQCKDTGNLDLINQELKSNLEREQKLNRQLSFQLAEQQNQLSADLQECEEREKKRAEVEIGVEKEATQLVKHSLQQVQAQLQATLAQVQAEREKSTQLICNIQDLERQLSNVKEALSNVQSSCERDREEFVREKEKLEVTLKHMYERKENAEKDAKQLRLQLDGITQKWEDQLFREKISAKTKPEINGHEDSSEVRQLRLKVQELENKLIKAQAQSSQLSAEQRAWISEKSSLISQLINHEHQTQVAKSLLATERTNWVLEKNRLLNESSRCASPHSDISDQGIEGKLQYLYAKCRRTESNRKALVWQKRYLLVMLRSSQATEERLKQHLLLINGPHNAHLLTSRKPLSSLQKFRSAAFVIMGIQRMQFIVRSRIRANALGSGVILKRMTEALLMSPEPRLDPPNSSYNGQSEASSFSPPTRDNSHVISSVSRNLMDTPTTSRHISNMERYKVRSDLVQQRLGLYKKTGSKM